LAGWGLSNLPSTATPLTGSSAAIKVSGTPFFDILPLPLLGANMFAMVQPPQWSHPQCPMSIYTAAEIKTKFDVFNTPVQDAYAETIAKAVGGITKLEGASKVLQSLNNFFDVCKDLPAGDKTELLNQHFMLYLAGTFGWTDFISAEYTGAKTKMDKLKKTFNFKSSITVNNFAICAAINPCTEDYLFAAKSLGVEVKLPIPQLPALQIILGIELTKLAISKRRMLEASITDAFDVFLSSQKGRTITTTMLFKSQLFFEAALTSGLAFGIPLSTKAVVKGSLDIAIKQKITGALRYGISDGRGLDDTHFVVTGRAGSPVLEIAGILSIPLTPTVPDSDVNFVLGVVVKPGGQTKLFYRRNEPSGFKSNVDLQKTFASFKGFFKTIGQILSSDGYGTVSKYDSTEIQVTVVPDEGVVVGVRMNLKRGDLTLWALKKFGLVDVNDTENIEVAIIVKRSMEGIWTLNVITNSRVWTGGGLEQDVGVYYVYGCDSFEYLAMTGGRACTLA